MLCYCPLWHSSRGRNGVIMERILNRKVWILPQQSMKCWASTSSPHLLLSNWFCERLPKPQKLKSCRRIVFIVHTCEKQLLVGFFRKSSILLPHALKLWSKNIKKWHILLVLPHVVTTYQKHVSNKDVSMIRQNDSLHCKNWILLKGR